MSDVDIPRTSHYGADEWESIIEHSSDIVTVLDRDGIIQFQSPAVERILGHGTEELLGEPAFDYIHPADVDRVVAVFNDLIASNSGETKRVEFRFQHANGAWVWFETIGSNRIESAIGGYVLNSRDITERKQGAEQLHEAKEFLSSVIDIIESAVWIRDIESKFLHINLEYRDLFDIEDDRQIVGVEPEELVGEERGRLFRLNDQRVIDTGETLEFEEEVSFKDGSRHYLTQITPLYDADSEPYATLGIAKDITKQKAKETELRERNKELEAFHFTAELFATRDDSIEKLLYIFIEQLPNWFQFPEHTEVRIAFDEIAISSTGFEPNDSHLSATVETQEGTTLHVEVIHSSEGPQMEFLAEEQRLLHTLASFVGETVDRRRHREELKLFKRAVEEAGHAVLITEKNGVIKYVNPAFEAQTGFSTDEAVGSSPRILKSGKHDQGFYEELWETILAGEEWYAELVNQRKDGSLYRVDQIISPIMDVNDEISHFVAMETEITELRLREQQLDVQNRILRHNLRNSLNVIGGHSDNIQETSDDPRVVKSTEAIQRQVEKLVAISDKSAKSRAALEYNGSSESTCELAELLRELEDEFRDKYGDVDISFEYPPSVSVKGDEQLKWVIEEAVENAIIHNDRSQPQVSISVTATEDASLGRVTELTIRDNGPGIPEDQQTVVEMGTETPLDHGNSIGLWNMNWIVTSVGGEMSIERMAPRGTQVTFRLPTPSTQN